MISAEVAEEDQEALERLEAFLDSIENPDKDVVRKSQKESGAEFYTTEDPNGWEEGFCIGGHSQGEETVRHGLFRSFAPSAWSHYSLCLFGRFEAGQPMGTFWKGQLGGGYIDIVPHGDEVAFIYPDLRSALYGKWEDGRMSSAIYCKVIGSVIDDEDARPLLRPVSSSEKLSFSFDPSTSKRISSSPLLRDPWEEEMVEVKESKIPGAGEGLFAKVNLESDTVVCLFQGVRIRNMGRFSSSATSLPPSDYRIRLNGDLDLDIPSEMTSTDCYRATLGHKANHSFVPNSAWSVFEHPRFGLIRSIEVIKDVKAGEEILVSYNISLDQALDWYKILWMDHMRSSKGWTERDFSRFVERQREMTMKRINLPM